MSGKQTRRYAKRSTRRLYQNMDKSLVRIQTLRGMFDDGHHVQHTELLSLIAQVQLQVQQFLVEFYIHAWSEEPNDWYSDVGT